MAPNTPPPGIWLGVSVEDQTRANERIPFLMSSPATVRWVSAEPLLGPIDLTNIAYPTHWPRCDCEDRGPSIDALGGTIYCEGCCEGAECVNSPIDWVVIGGESGAGARPMHPDWARALRDQCADAEVPFFFKQWGSWSPTDLWHPADRRAQTAIKPDGDEVPYDVAPQDVGGQRFLEVGKKAAGDLLDGVRHHNWPTTELMP